MKKQIINLVLLLLAFACSAAGAQASEPPSDVKAQLQETYGKLPLYFEANQGQTDRQVKFLNRGRGYSLFLTPTEAVLALSPRPTEGEGQGEGATLRMQFAGANPEAQLTGLEKLPGIVNYFIGNDPKKWRTNIPTYKKVEYKEVYPGVNLIYYGTQGQLEYDLVAAPGSDPNQIRLAFQGTEDVKVDTEGNLVLKVAGGQAHLHAPSVYQEIKGKKQTIAARYVLQASSVLSPGAPIVLPAAMGHGEGQGEGGQAIVSFQVGFQVAAYDASRPLIIDPVLVYSSYLGGSGGGQAEQGQGIAVDGAGNAYVTGTTDSSNFPTTAGAFQTTFGGPGISDQGDVFVTKFDPNGSMLIYSTYLGGSGIDDGGGIALDTTGHAYVTGVTFSTDFPTTAGAFQTTPGEITAFVTKLNPTGSALVYSTYLGGSGVSSQGRGIAVDAAGDAYITGPASSTGFPTTAGAFDTTGNGAGDVFVTKLDPIGSALIYSTYLGGSGDDEGFGIALDVAGHAYVTGQTFSADFPTTPGAFQTTFGGIRNAFVTKLDPTGSALVYSTYLGGSGEFDQGRAIAVDAAGHAYVTGQTFSADFPTTAGAFQTTFSFSEDAFVTKLNPTGSALVYSTYLGGSDHGDLGRGIAVDGTGNAYVTGRTPSTDFPTTPGAFQPTSGGNGADDAFVTKLNPTGSALVYSTYLGGSRTDDGGGIALDTLPQPNAYVTGYTDSTDFPTTPGAFQPTFAGAFFDVFVAKVGPFNTPVGTNVSVSAGHSVTVTFTAVVTPGDTGATTSDTGPAPPAGFTVGTPPTYYDVTTTATYTPPVGLCITYDPVQFGDPGSLRLFHFENDMWVDVTTSHDTTNHVICGQVNSFSLFAIAQPGSPLTSLGPANIWVGLKNNSDGVGIRFDLRAEVYRNSTQLVGAGEVASVPGGSAGFNNANQHTIPLTPVEGASFQSGTTISIKLYARNACTGSGNNSGAARLWFNDSEANSRFDATIGGNPRTYFLRDAFALATSPGPGPKKTADVAAGAKCSPYKTFGTWTTTIP